MIIKDMRENKTIAESSISEIKEFGDYIYISLYSGYQLILRLNELGEVKEFIPGKQND